MPGPGRDLRHTSAHRVGNDAHGHAMQASEVRLVHQCSVRQAVRCRARLSVPPIAPLLRCQHHNICWAVVKGACNPYNHNSFAAHCHNQKMVAYT